MESGPEFGKACISVKVGAEKYNIKVSNNLETKNMFYKYGKLEIVKSLKKNKQERFLTLSHMAYRILWLLWGGGLNAPSRYQGRNHF